MALFDLVEGPSVVVSASVSYVSIGPRTKNLRGYGDVTTIDDCCPVIEWVGIQRHVVATTESNLA